MSTRPFSATPAQQMNCIDETLHSCSIHV